VTSLLEKALRSDLALASLEELLIRKARELYRLGFTLRNIAPSQMAAVDELLAIASSRADAERRVKTWMTGQLDKLQEEKKRTREARSWLKLPEPGGSEESLGKELLTWISGDSYLGEEQPGHLDRLDALRRFWARLYGLYRYEVETKQDMPLSTLDLLEPKEAS
jgi:hypothetical protein